MVTKYFVRLAAIFLLGIVPLIHVFAATAKVDRSRIGIDDTFTLSIELPSNNSSASPDLSVLDQDFDVLGTTQSSQIQIINGRTSSSTQWLVTLAPKREGKLTIPPLKVGKEATQALTIQVSKTSPQAAAQKDVLLEAEVDVAKPYVQQQVILTVRLLHRVPLREGALAKPQIRDAIIERLGEDTAYDTKRGGDTYHVVERRYAVFPQKSVAIEISGLHFDGKVPDPRAQNRGLPFGRGFFDDPFDLMQPTTSVRVRAPAIVLDVKPIPAGAQASPWLPARNLKVEESWSENPPKFSVGQPITRTITLQASGLNVTQLPPLEPPELSFANTYPDHNSKQARADVDGVISESEQKLAIIPHQSGTFELPEIRIPWWNVEKDRQEFAVVPSRKLSVAAGAGTTAAPPPQPDPEHASEGMEMESVDFSRTSARETSSDIWRLVGVGALTAWLVTLALWLLDRRRRPRQLTPDGGLARRREQPTISSEAVRKACAANNAAEVSFGLIAWARGHWPEKPFNNLGDVAALTDNDAIKQAIWSLDRALYGNGASPWNGAEFLAQIEPLFKKKRRKGTMGPALPPLYPSETRGAA